MLQAKIIGSLESLLDIRDDWNNLYTQCKISYPFLTFEWVATWWKYFGKGNEMSVLLVLEDNELIAIAPFMYTTKSLRKIPLKTITFLTNYHSNRMEIMILKEKHKVMEFILNHFFSIKPRVDLIELDFIPEESQSRTAIDDALATQKLRNLKYVDFESPYLIPENDWETYLNERPKRLRQKIRSIRRKHSKDIEILRYKEFDEDCIKRMHQISNKTWKSKENSAIVSQQETSDFYTTMAKIAAEKDWLDILILKYKGNPVAFDYKLIYNGTNYCLKIGYDLDYSKCSPGQFLMSHSIQNSFEDGLQEFDFVGAKSRFKMEWADSLRNHYKYLIFSKNLFGSCASFLELDIIRKFKLNELYHKFKQKTGEKK